MVMIELVQGRGIEGLTLDSSLAHADERRSIYVPFNGLVFPTVGQVKALVLNQDARLGGHFHEYGEGFLVLGPDAVFCLEDVDNGNKDVYTLTNGERIVFPRNVGHVVFARAGTTLVGFDSEPYVPGRSDQPFEMPWAEAYSFGR